MSEVTDLLGILADTLLVFLTDRRLAQQILQPSRAVLQLTGFRVLQRQMRSPVSRQKPGYQSSSEVSWCGVEGWVITQRCSYAV